MITTIEKYLIVKVPCKVALMQPIKIVFSL